VFLSARVRILVLLFSFILFERVFYCTFNVLASPTAHIKQLGMPDVDWPMGSSHSQEQILSLQKPMSSLPVQHQLTKTGNGYRYAGLEYYGECFCGATVNGVQIDESNCNYPCTGNSSEVCGGTDIISVYQDPTFLPVDDTIITDYKPLGCYSDLGPDGRTLAWQQTVDATALTVETCLTACKQEGYPFAGVEYAQECWCGVVLGLSHYSSRTRVCSDKTSFRQ
jgi:hypothetical protein